MRFSFEDFYLDRERIDSQVIEMQQKISRQMYACGPVERIRKIYNPNIQHDILQLLQIYEIIVLSMSVK